MRPLAALTAVLLAGCAATASPPPSPPADCAGRVVTDAEQLQTALSAAEPGQTISVAPGQYPGHFTINRPATQSAPIRLCGWGGARLDGPAGGYTLHLEGADWWIVENLSVTGGQIGVVLDSTSGARLDGLDISGSGHEAVHLRSNSSGNELTGLKVHDTGTQERQFGEGVYVGSAESNWCDYTDCGPDRSDHNVIRDSVFGPGITAEQIDIKEGTTGGVVRGNTFEGEGLTDADSWLDAKGNDWRIVDNSGHRAPLDGMQVHEVSAGWGTGNTFTGNRMHVDAAGYGIRVPVDDTTTVVACDNTVTGAAAGLSNVACRSQ